MSRNCKTPFLFVLMVLLGACGTSSRVSMQESDEVAGRRFLDFAGYRWEVKQRNYRTGPGDNFWSDSTASVWKDTAGVHLRLRYENGRWFCAAIFSQKKGWGYGTYRFKVKGRYDQMDKNIVIGLFTYEYKGERKTPQENEIDMELSRWGDEHQKYNTQYGFQYRKANSMRNLIDYHYYKADLSKSDETEHVFRWKRNHVEFWSYQWFSNKKKQLTKYQIRDKRVPNPGKEGVHMNIWLRKGFHPVDKEPLEIILTDFSFIPED